MYTGEILFCHWLNRQLDLAVTQERHVLVCEPFCHFLSLRLNPIHFSSISALICDWCLTFLHFRQSPILECIENANPRTGCPHLFQFKLRVVYKKESVRANIQLPGDCADALALWSPRYLWAEKVFIDMEPFENLHSFRMI